jgi:Arc/MetJ-type ribon-helix-helix transcriptional regulator
VASRSDGVRRALAEMLDRHRRRKIGEETVEAYRRLPQTEEGLAGVVEAARPVIEAEPW